jgi:hypothetical protein
VRRDEAEESTQIPREEVADEISLFCSCFVSHVFSVLLLENAKDASIARGQHGPAAWAAGRVRWRRRARSRLEREAQTTISSKATVRSGEAPHRLYNK